MSTQDSPTLTNNRLPARSISPAAVHQPQQTKRDKKRTMLSDRFNDLVTSFSVQHKDQYYAQLYALQCDINLIMRCDPYPGPVDDDSETISKLVSEVRDEIFKNSNMSAEAEESFTAMAGRSYSSFVDEVNRAMEERDRDLALTYNHYQDGLDELRRTNQYKLQLAQEEHQLLSKTLRDRLIQNLTQRRSKLLRDKEQLDIADSNALLLNPNQFSLGNASPGGPHNNRKTRNTRLRPGDVDEAATNAISEGNKRKRKGVLDEDDSPAPLGRMGGLFPNPFRDAKSKLMHSQFDAPAYSIDRLFTEKELALNLTRAHLATDGYFTRARASGIKTTSGNTTHPGSGAEDANETDGAGSVGLHGLDGTDAGTDTPARAGSPTLNGLLGQSSFQSYHATRSTQRANPLNELANTATSLGPFALSFAATATKANPAAPTPPGLPETEAANDFALFTREPNDPIILKILERSMEKAPPMVAGAPSSYERDGPLADGSNDGATHVHGAVPGFNAAAISMARSGSGYGLTFGGGVAMSKTNSEGGVSMSRSVSAADFGARRA